VAKATRHRELSKNHSTSSSPRVSCRRSLAVKTETLSDRRAARPGDLNTTHLPVTVFEGGRAMATKAEERRIQEFREAKENLREELLRHPDVRTIGVGYRKKKGKRTKELTIVLGVRKKLPEAMLDKSRVLPKRISYFSKIQNKAIQIPIDVQEVGEPVNYACGACDTDLRARIRPVPGGVSLSGPPGTGTLGGWVWDDLGNQIALVSNNHVLGGVVASAVRQPGAADGGVAADQIAQVLRTGTLDATIATPTAGDIARAEIECLGGAVFEIVEPGLEMQVEKVGRTTSRTCGTISQIHVDLGHFGSTDDFIVDTDDPAVRFAFFGDSGSLIVERTNPGGDSWKRVVGLLWGGDPPAFNAFAHPMSDVFSNLSLKTVCAGIIEAILDSIVFSAPEFGLADDAALRQVRKGFARELEKRFLQQPTGRKFHEMLHKHRAPVVSVLLSGDGRRAVMAALKPILADKVTTDEVLKHKLTRQDVENFRRVLRTARQLQPRLAGAAVRFAEALLKRAEGLSVASLIALKRLT
jgi:hypothetical protein